ncbi:hypothetical protein [Chachezhania antarctica]|uniref:hypothetical protein n=1 Tax=Chachezhania antarctica TaxID=2340860 RepID=UPI000EB40B94|nr:hypothetical protein [Chachezhania antarctica]
MKALTAEERAAIAAFLDAGGQIARAPAPSTIEGRALDGRRECACGRRSGPEPRIVRRMGIRQALEWAFGVEHARLSFDDARGDAGQSYGMEYVLMRQAMLGQQVDVSRGCSAPADDAEMIAAVVQGTLGRADAIWVAELARAGATPDAMIGATPKIVPARMRDNQHGRSPETADAADLGVEGWKPQPRRNRKGVIVMDAVRYTPCRWERTPLEIALARRRYLNWIDHLMTILASLRHEPLRWIDLTSELPEIAPWRKTY